MGFQELGRYFSTLNWHVFTRGLCSLLLAFFFCELFVFWQWLNCRGRWVVGWARKGYLGLAEIASFSSGDFSYSNKHNTF